MTFKAISLATKGSKGRQGRQVKCVQTGEVGTAAEFAKQLATHFGVKPAAISSAISRVLKKGEGTVYGLGFQKLDDVLTPTMNNVAGPA